MVPRTVYFSSHAGLYQTLLQVGYSPLVQLSGLVAQVAVPIVFAQAGDGTDQQRLESARRRVRHLGGLMLVATAIFASILRILGPVVFGLVVAQQYRGVASYLPVVAISGGFFATGQMLANDALLQIDSKALVIPDPTLWTSKARQLRSAGSGASRAPYGRPGRTAQAR